MMKRIFTAVCGAALLAATPAMADDTLTTEEAQYIQTLESQLGGTLMNNPMAMNYGITGEGKYKKKVSMDPDVPGGAVLKVDVRQPGRQTWDTSVQLQLDGAVTAGDTVSVAFWARTERAPKGADGAQFTAVMQGNTDPYLTVVMEEMEIGEEWELHEMTGVAEHSLRDGNIQLAFNMGDKRQAVEFGQLFVIHKPQ